MALRAIELPDATLSYDAGFLPAAEADRLFATLQQNLQWRQDRIQLFGREVDIPRLQAWYGDPGTDYRYSGLLLHPEPWTPALLGLKQAVERACESVFNSVLINLYRDGRDGVGWHRDDEPELGSQPVIASVSLGGSRRFCLRHRRHRDLKHEIELPGGSLLLMAGGTQQHWLHAVPKTRRACAPRINLSFRRVLI